MHADDKSDDLLGLGGSEVKTPVTLKHMEISLLQFWYMTGLPNVSTFNKWKYQWVAGFLEDKHQSIIPR